MRIVACGYDHPDVAGLVEAVQAEYRTLYGGGDESPTAAEQFANGAGWFAVGYLAGVPVAMGGWRWLPPRPGASPARRAEIKRMYVVPTVRGRGLSRVLLAAIEESARGAGVEQLVLETGQYQPTAIALYRSCGYADVTPDFGHYAGEELAVHLGKPL